MASVNVGISPYSAGTPAATLAWIHISRSMSWCFIGFAVTLAITWAASLATTWQNSRAKQWQQAPIRSAWPVATGHSRGLVRRSPGFDRL